MDTDDTTASAGQKKAGQWPAAYYRAPCYEFRESDRTNKFYRPRSLLVLVLESSSFALSSGTGVPPVCFCPATATTFAAIHGRDARATTPAATCIRSNTRPGFVKELSLFGQQLSLRRHFQIGLGLYAVTRRLQNQPVVTGEGGGLEFLRT